MKQASRWLTCVILILAAVCSGCGGGDDSAGNATDLTGEWTFTEQDTLQTYTVTLAQSGNNVTGTTSLGDTVAGTVEGSAFNVVFSYIGGALTVHGTLSADGDSISGTWEAVPGEIHPFAMTRSGSAGIVTITGQWLMELEGMMTMTLTLTQQGNLITGRVWETGSEVTGTVSGNTLELVLLPQVAGDPEFEYSGTISADVTSVEGTYHNVTTDDTGSWRLTKQ